MRISGINYDVEYLEPEQLEGCLGTADFDRQRICISNRATFQTKRIALLHETIHILDRTYGIGLDEKQVVLLTHALIALKEDNPDANII